MNELTKTCFTAGYNALTSLYEAKKGCEERDTKKAISHLSDVSYYLGSGATCGAMKGKVTERGEVVRPLIADALPLIGDALDALVKKDWDKAQDKIKTAISYF